MEQEKTILEKVAEAKQNLTQAMDRQAMEPNPANKANEDFWRTIYNDLVAEERQILQKLVDAAREMGLIPT